MGEVWWDATSVLFLRYNQKELICTVFTFARHKKLYKNVPLTFKSVLIVTPSNNTFPGGLGQLIGLHFSNNWNTIAHQDGNHS